MNKLRRDLKISLAGMCCGLFSFSVFLLAARINSYYAYLRWYEESGYEGTYGGVEDLWWAPIALWHVVLTMAASLLIHRYLAIDGVSPFLRWQAIGLVALIAWGLTIFIGVSLDCLVRGNMMVLERQATPAQFRSIAQFLSTVFAANVLFGSAIQAASAEDVREGSHSPTTDNAI